MHKLSIAFLLLSIFIFNSCEDKKDSNNTKTKMKNIKPIIKIFTFKNTKGEEFHINTSNKKVLFKENSKPISIITFLSASCTPCIHEIPYLNILQKEYNSKIFISTILLKNNMKKDKLDSFIKQHKIKYFISNSKDSSNFADRIVKDLKLSKNFSIPLTIIYVNGKYFTHYEGIVPIEMMEYDIKEAINKIKKG